MCQINPKSIVESGVLKICEHSLISQVGVDLSLSQSVLLAHGQSMNVLLNEEVHLPDDIFATFTHRSSFNRKGVLVTGSIYDPGYKGQVGCTIYNLSGSHLSIPINERVGQMVFFRADAASKYEGQYQGEGLKREFPKRNV